MDKKCNIIALCGRKQSGKTEMANVCKTEFENVKVFSFGTALKNLCAELLNITYDELNEIKNIPNKFSIKPDERWVNIISNRTGIMKDLVKEKIKNVTFTSVRVMLQKIGTDVIREYNPDWHVNTLINEILEYDKNTIIVVDDCRFVNEKKALEQLGAKMYFVIRPTNLNVSNHESETNLKWYAFGESDVIVNDMALDKFKEYWRIEFKRVIGLSHCLNTFKNPIFTNNRIFEGFDYAFSLNSKKWTSTCAGILLEHKAVNTTNGRIIYNTDNKHLYNIVYSTLYGTSDIKGEIGAIDLYNPYIVENLKIYMD